MFSLGAILFEMVTQESADIHREGIKPQVPRQCSQEVYDLIEACLQDDPIARPISEHVSEVLSVLVSAAGTIQHRNEQVASTVPVGTWVGSWLG